MANKALIADASDLSLDQKVMALLICVAQEKKAEASRLLGGTVLSLLQLNLLHALSKAPGKSLTVNQLRELMVEDSPNVSRTLNKLAEQGLVEKTRSAEDQRTVFVSITDAGEQAHIAADERLEVFSTGLSERDLRTLYRLLVKL